MAALTVRLPDDKYQRLKSRPRAVERLSTGLIDENGRHAHAGPVRRRNLIPTRAARGTGRSLRAGVAAQGPQDDWTTRPHDPQDFIAKRAHLVACPARPMP